MKYNYGFKLGKWEGRPAEPLTKKAFCSKALLDCRPDKVQGMYMMSSIITMKRENNRHGLGTQPFNTCSNRCAPTINHKCQSLRNMQLYINIQNNFMSFASHCNIFSILKCFCNFPSCYGNKLITQNTFTCSKSTSYCNVWGLFWYCHTVYNNKIV